MLDMFVLVTHKRPTEGALSKAFNGFRLWMEQCKNLLLLLNSRDLPLGAKDRLYSPCLCSVMLHGSKTW